jgi:peptidoglycan/LPS O-acetylase OafA/YrhL
MRYMNVWLAATIGLVVAIGAAWAWYLLIEAPSVRLSRKIALEAPEAAKVPLRATPDAGQ